jgi:hypothetical protein
MVGRGRERTGGIAADPHGQHAGFARCRDGGDGQSFCVYVPSETVAMTFVAADQDAARRRLQHLIEAVQPLPTGATPLSGASAG